MADLKDIFSKWFGKQTSTKTPSNNIKASMGTIVVNGKTYYGKSVSVINDQVYIDGKLASEEKYTGIVEVKITGDVSLVKSDAPVTIEGNVTGDVTSGGYVSCKNVTGNVKASGYISCDDVKGNASAGGFLDCGNIGGDAKAGGYINRK